VRDVTLALAVALAGSGCGAAASLAEPDAEAGPVFVAVGAEGTIVSSPDGISWTPRVSGTSTDLFGVAASRQALVAVGARGTIVSSPDGVFWTAQDSHTSTDLAHVIFDGERFVAVGGSFSTGAVTLKSHDGTSWTLIESPASYMFHAVAHAGTTLVAAAYFRSDLQTPALFTSEVSPGSSSNGWRQLQGPDFYDSVTLDGEISVVGGGSVSSSRDGISWTTRQLPGGLPGTSIAASGSAFVVVGERGKIFGLEHGACGAESCWTERQAPPGTTLWTGVTHGAEIFVAVGGDGAIATSPDSWTWAPRAGGTTQSLSDVAYSAQ
jgi:hypothetical protein